MSNSQAVPESLSEYLAHLPMTDEQRAELASCTSFAELHERLSAQTVTDSAEAAQASVGRRLTLTTADELQDAEMLSVDASGRVVLKATPPIRRTKVVPEPWRTNILHRGWRRLSGKTNPPKPSKDDLPRDLPKSRWRTVGSIRRYILLILMLGQTIIAGFYMKGILPYQGWSLVSFDEISHQTLWQTAVQVMPYALQTSILLLFGILFCWVSAGFWTALMGFLELLTGRDKYRISGASAGNEPIEAGARTALVMPICNEDVPRVFAGLRATFESVAATGDLDRFDFFVLSDTNETDIAVAEQQAWLDVCRETGGFGRIFYRRRRRRVKRKSGNLDDFCRRWGGDYRYMVVLDADSVMSGECLTSLVRLMEATPDAGIIQTAPRASGMDTPVCAHAAVRHSRVRPAVHRGSALLAVGRIPLLGSQRDHPHEAVHRALRPGAIARERCFCRCDSVSRLR
jgi:membrane glycosyltransferase